MKDDLTPMLKLKQLNDLIIKVKRNPFDYSGKEILKMLQSMKLDQEFHEVVAEE